MFYAPLSTENLSKKALVGVEGRKLNSICALGTTTAPASLTLFNWYNWQFNWYNNEFRHLQNTLLKLVC